MPHKGIYKRRDLLPHWDFENSLQAITFRLADSLPAALIKSWKSELSTDHQPSPETQALLHRRIARYEDAGHGSCLLSDPDVAGIVQFSLITKHQTDYRLIAWVIMPNHVHVIVRLLDHTPISTILQQWKGGSSILVNKHLDRSGRLWHPDYYDRLIRDQDHYHNAIAYIRNNPVKAGLCATPEDWPFSSAALKWSPDFSPTSSSELSD